MEKDLNSSGFGDLVDVCESVNEEEANEWR